MYSILILTPQKGPHRCPISMHPSLRAFYIFLDIWLSKEAWVTYQEQHPLRKLTFPISQLSISNHFFTRNGTYYLDFVWLKLNSMCKSSLNSYLLEIVLNLMRNFTSYQYILATFTPECKYFQISHYCCSRVHSWVRCMSIFFFSHVYDTS